MELRLLFCFRNYSLTLQTIQKGRVFYDANPFFLVRNCSARGDAAALLLLCSRHAGGDAGSSRAGNRCASPYPHADQYTNRRAGNAVPKRGANSNCNAHSSAYPRAFPNPQRTKHVLKLCGFDLV